jgi:hypothetical protein
MALFNKALFLSQQKIFALTHRRVYTLMVNLFQILNQFVLFFGKNVIEKSSMVWRVLPLVKINTRLSETPCILLNLKCFFTIVLMHLIVDNCTVLEHYLDYCFDNLISRNPWRVSKSFQFPSNDIF